MGTTTPELPAESRETIQSDVSGLASFFIDPKSAARRVFTKWFWVGPLLIFSIVSVISSLIIIPITEHVMQVAPLPAGVPPEQAQKSMQIGISIMRGSMYLSPVIAAVIYAFQALVLFVMSMVVTVRASFRQIFNLVAGCSLIQLLSGLAGVLILKAKGDISTMAELRPAMGLDIFLPEGTSKVLMGILGYFSIFEVWWIVMLVLIYSAAYRVSKGKAFVVILPLVLISLIFRVVGAVFSP